MKRKLVLFEEEYEIYNSEGKGSLLVARLLRIRGAITIEIIKQSLSILQERHPYLRLSVVKTKNEFYFDCSKNLAVPIRIVPRERKNQWHQVLEEEINSQFNS